MTTTVEVANALVSAGYLTDAEVEAAAAVLADALVVADAEETIDAALDDEAYQEGVIVEAEERSDEDAAVLDFEDADIEDGVIAEAEDREVVDEQIIAEAEDTIAVAYSDAAAALLAAELIDEADLDDVAEAIADVWVVDDDRGVNSSEIIDQKVKGDKEDDNLHRCCQSVGKCRIFERCCC